MFTISDTLQKNKKKGEKNIIYEANSRKSQQKNKIETT